MKNILKILSISLFLFISSFGINIARAVTPTILGITSTTLDGTYKAGDIVNITLNFSEPITSTGDVIVTLETGAIDRTCTFQVTSSNIASCDYVVQEGDTTLDLDVANISGIIKNATDEVITDLTPLSTLASTKNIIIDTTFTIEIPIVPEEIQQQVIPVTVPTITNITSSRLDGTIGVGGIIDINLTFSEPVTSTGDVIVTLETGTIDRTCTFQVVSSNTASCNYTVQTGDTSVDLNVNTIVGVLKNAVEETMVNMIPDVNLATNKAFVIDTTPITITNITSSKADGVYITGDVIDLNITFSKTISTDIVNRTNAGSRIWYSVTSSSDGTKLAAIDSAYIYTSTDSGVTWSQRMSASPYPQIRRVGKLISNDSTIIPYSFSNITS
jgi:hypothetical protein